MSTVAITSGLLALVLQLWHRRGPSTPVLISRRQVPDVVLADGSVRCGDVIEVMA